MTLFDFDEKNAPQRDENEPDADQEEELSLAEASYCFGVLLLFFGVGSLVLNWLGMEFCILMWIDNWGEGIGMSIRLGAVVAGAVLFALGKKPDSD